MCNVGEVGFYESCICRVRSHDIFGFRRILRPRIASEVDEDHGRLRMARLLNDSAVVDDRGLRLEADAVAEPLSPYDMLFVPGGFGTRSLQHDGSFLNWLKTARSVPLKVSVCTGALLLGAAGFLQGRRATTHPTAYKELEPYCGAVVQERVVDEGDIITARGVSSAIDMGLHLVQRLAGADARDRVAAQMDYPYRWNL